MAWPQRPQRTQRTDKAMGRKQTLSEWFCVQLEREVYPALHRIAAQLPEVAEDEVFEEETEELPAAAGADKHGRPRTDTDGDGVALVFSGASSKLPLHVGAWKAIVEARLPIAEAWGTSAGAIVAAAVACDVPPGRLEWLMYETSFAGLVRGSWPVMAWNALTGAGLNSTSRLREFLRHVFGSICLCDVEMPLHVLAHSLGLGTWVDLSAETAPQVMVYEAVTASAAIPLWFRPVRLLVGDRWDYYVDGGMSKNLAVDCVAPGRRIVAHLVEDPARENWEKICLRQMAGEVFEQLLDANTQEAIRDAAEAKPLIARTADTTPMLEFDLSREQKEEMVRRGYESMQMALETHNLGIGRADG